LDAVVKIALSLQHIELLRQHAWLPHDVEIPALPGGYAPRADLLPLLLQAWQVALAQRAPRTQLARARRMVDLLTPLVRAGAELTRGLPRAACGTLQTSVGGRLVLWPRGQPPGRWVGIVSSRLGHRLQNQTSWFAALRDTCQRFDPDHTTLVAAQQTATCAYLQRCRDLFRLPLLCFEVARSRQTLRRWLDTRLREPFHDFEPGSLDWPVHVSPPLLDVVEHDQPVRDRLVVAASDQLVVLRMRRNGNIESLVRQRLGAAIKPTESGVTLIVGPGLVPVDLADALPPADRLIVPNKSRRETVTPPVGCVTTRAPILRPAQLVDRTLLIHWTRARVGPWPDETWEDYRDALIMCHHDTDRSALAALARIAAQRRLLATNITIRGGAPVVCFTARALGEMKELRKFRVHRQRWDFEPYGICIERAWLERLGARPVIYGNAELWERLDDRQRPFFQQRFTRGEARIDWAVEQEWRVEGNVDLRQLPEDSAVLFVPTLKEAYWLSCQSPWPIVVLGD
jgi:hypothetical protein